MIPQVPPLCWHGNHHYERLPNAEGMKYIYTHMYKQITTSLYMFLFCLPSSILSLSFSFSVSLCLSLSFSLSLSLSISLSPPPPFSSFPLPPSPSQYVLLGGLAIFVLVHRE